MTLRYLASLSSKLISIQSCAYTRSSEFHTFNVHFSDVPTPPQSSKTPVQFRSEASSENLHRYGRCPRLWSGPAPSASSAWEYGKERGKLYLFGDVVRVAEDVVPPRQRTICRRSCSLGGWLLRGARYASTRPERH
jgi:hypothetical protein